MTAEQKIKIRKFEQEKDQIFEKIRKEYYPNIPEEVFIPLQNFLFFMGRNWIEFYYKFRLFI